MQITPRDIKEMQFNMKIRGYDPEEVKNFLDMVSSEFEKVIIQNNDLKNKVKRLENELEEYRDKDDKFDKILMTAQNFSENEKERVEKDIEIKYKEADLEIKQMMQEAKKRKAELESDIEKLKSKKKTMIKEYERFLEKQTDIIQELKKEIYENAVNNDNFNV